MMEFKIYQIQYSESQHEKMILPHKSKTQQNGVHIGKNEWFFFVI